MVGFAIGVAGALSVIALPIFVALLYFFSRLSTPRVATQVYVRNGQLLVRHTEPAMARTQFIHPDDPRHAYADIRAWDRNLVRHGLIPVGTSDVSQVKDYQEFLFPIEYKCAGPCEACRVW